MSQPDRFPQNGKESELPDDNVASSVQVPPSSYRLRLSLREFIGLVTIAMLGVGLVMTAFRLRRSEQELARLRSESGYLAETNPGQIAAARAPSDQPLTYRIRVRVPENESRYRVAYSSLWPRRSTTPKWFGAVPVPPGESLITVRIQEDPRDKRWKIATVVGSRRGNQRMSTVLPADHVIAFRGSHDVISTGVGRETLALAATQRIRLLDERWLVGEGSLLLYGDRAPDNDQIGIYAELQPDVGPL
ncbi:MAG: hypothetical protein ACR2NZ_13675 [Rubripirellula sp.]